MTTQQPDHPADQQESASPLEPVPMEPVAPPERRSRAGRNLPAAIGVGVALAGLIITSLYLTCAGIAQQIVPERRPRIGG